MAKHKYIVTVRGSVPADLIERISRIHAKAMESARPSVASADSKDGAGSGGVSKDRSDAVDARYGAKDDVTEDHGK